MKNWKYIELTLNGNRADLHLNRPEIHNALNPDFIAETLEAIHRISKMNNVQFLVLSGRGKSFCAGADINWFAACDEKSMKKKRQEYLQIPTLLNKWLEIPQITIAAVHGNALGGAIGLMAVNDFVFADKNTSFAFGEIKLGIIPATIMPFVNKRISTQNMKKMMLTGQRFFTSEALNMGLIDYETRKGQLSKEVNTLIEKLEISSSNAQRAYKKLLKNIESGKTTTKNSKYTANLLAKLISSPEGQQGLKAFQETQKHNRKKTKTPKSS